MSFFGEGFINAGYFGLIVFTLLLALFNAKFDHNFWESNVKTHVHSLFEMRGPSKTLHLVVVGLHVSIVNGDSRNSTRCVVPIQVGGGYSWPETSPPPGPSHSRASIGACIQQWQCPRLQCWRHEWR